MGTYNVPPLVGEEKSKILEHQANPDIDIQLACNNYVFMNNRKEYNSI